MWNKKPYEWMIRIPSSLLPQLNREELASLIKQKVLEIPPVYNHLSYFRLDLKSGDFVATATTQKEYVEGGGKNDDTC